jgi:hypothetical protein
VRETVDIKVQTYNRARVVDSLCDR